MDFFHQILRQSKEITCYMHIEFEAIFLGFFQQNLRQSKEITCCIHTEFEAIILVFFNFFEAVKLGFSAICELTLTFNPKERSDWGLKLVDY